MRLDDFLVGEEADEKHSYLTFLLGQQLFASKVEKVINILDLYSFIKIPSSMPSFLGAMNIHGEIIPIVDLNQKIALGTSQFTSSNCILILKLKFLSRTINIGAVVDSVEEVLEIDNMEIEGIENFILPNLCIECFDGIVDYDERKLLILDFDRLFTSFELKLIVDAIKAESQTLLSTESMPVKELRDSDKSIFQKSIEKKIRIKLNKLIERSGFDIYESEARS